MKKILFLIAILMCCVMTIFAQNNDRISYQAVVRDANNNLVVNRELTVQVTVNDGQNTYTETHTVTSNANGLISFLIGNGNHASNNWDNINWKTATVSTTMSDGGVQIAAHAMPLTTVPSAKYADYADSVNPDVVARQIHDTADIVRQKVGDVSEKVSNLENRLKTDSANLKDHYYTKTQVDTAKTQIRTTMATMNTNLQNNIDTASSHIREAMATMNTNLGNGIAENRQAIIDSSEHIRTEMSTMNSNLKNGIAENKQAIIDSSEHIRTEMSTMNSNLKNGIAENKQAIIDSSEHIRTEMSTMNTNLENSIAENRQAIIDSSEHIRTEMSTMNTNLVNGIAENRQAIIDSSEHIRTEMSTMNTNLVNGIAENRQAIIDSTDHVRDNLRDTALTLRGLIKTTDDKFANYYTTAQIDQNVDSVKGNIRTEITALKTNANALYATKAKVKADSNVVFDTLHNYYATKSSVASQLSNYTTTSDLQTNYATKNDLNAYTTTTDLQANYATKTTLHDDSLLLAQRLDAIEGAGYITKNVNDLTYYTTTNDLQNNYATLIELGTVNAGLATKANASDVYTKYDVDTAKASIRANLLQLAEALEILYYTKEVSDKFIATENQTTFTLSNSPTENHLVKMYINGVLVGDNVTINYYNDPPTTFYAVIEFDPNSNDYEVTYKPASNGGYQLRAGDRVVFYYYTTEEPPYQGD